MLQKKYSPHLTPPHFRLKKNKSAFVMCFILENHLNWCHTHHFIYDCFITFKLSNKFALNFLFVLFHFQRYRGQKVALFRGKKCIKWCISIFGVIFLSVQDRPKTNIWALSPWCTLKGAHFEHLTYNIFFDNRWLC